MKMVPSKTLLDQIVQHLLLYGSFTGNLGLLKGKMGVVIFFYYYSKYVDKNLYDVIAGELLDEIIENLNEHVSIDFEDGFCGIGWGILHLIEKGFVNADADYILSDIDQKIMERNLMRLNDNSLEKGLMGIAHYAVKRKKLDRTYMIELLDSMKSVGFVDDCFELLKNELSQLLFSENSTLLNHSAHLLYRLVEKVEPYQIDIPSRKLGIINNGLAGIGLKLMWM